MYRIVQWQRNTLGGLHNCCYIHCLQDNLWGYRLSLHCGRSGAAGTKKGQLLKVKATS